MPKSDDKGEPVKTVRIGGREVEVPIIFVLPEEAGEKEIERYERPKVHIKKEEKAAESEEEPLEELTNGILEEVEKPKVSGEDHTDDVVSTVKRRKRLQDYFESTKAKKKKKKEPLLSNSWEALREEWSDVLPDESVEKSWEKWLQKKQTRIDRKQEWGDKSKIGIGSWEDNPELKPKGRFDKDGKRIPEKGQGDGTLREGAL
jgi:hypothetical protein